MKPLPPAKPVKPEGLDTPGLIYRPRKNGWLLMWSPRSDLVARGYPGKTWHLWPPSGANPPPLEPTAEEWEAISRWCDRYQFEMIQWGHGGKPSDPASVFDGTIKSLIKLYQIDTDSPFHAIRYETKQRYTDRLRLLEETVGSVRIDTLTFRDLKRWYEKFAAPDVPGGPEKPAMANALIKHLQFVFSFGALALPDSKCTAIVAMFRELGKQRAFPRGRIRRTEYLTYRWAELVCEEANRRGLHSMALAQALQFECGVRQKDVVGEWVARTEPGVTDIFAGPNKWLMGMRWEEIDVNFVWTHRLSKSVKKANIMRPEIGKTEQFDLKAFPLVVAQLQRMWKPAGALDSHRGDFPANGPVIVRESTGRPWFQAEFRTTWRKLARAVGIPDEVQNRDSRAGAATEADVAGVAIDKSQRLLGHSRKETTGIYLRDGMEIRSQIAKVRAEKRK